MKKSFKISTPTVRATGILVSPSGEILMHQRDDGNGWLINYPNTRVFPGGRKANEDEGLWIS